MGGYGSTRWGSYTPHGTIEASLRIPMAPVSKALRNPPYEGWVTWSSQGEFVGSIGYRCTDPNVLMLKYTVNHIDPPRSVKQAVFISWARLTFGQRPYFECWTCDRRATDLYYSRQHQKFVCRRCAELTYSSCQDEYQERQMAAMLGIGLAELRLLEREFAQERTARHAR